MLLFRVKTIVRNVELVCLKDNLPILRVPGLVHSKMTGMLLKLKAYNFAFFEIFVCIACTP